jgi:MarR family transcriptional regulator, organic hydroperoxide resistance regulator
MVLSIIVINEIEAAGVVAALQRATHVTMRALGVSLYELDLTGSEQNVLAALADGKDCAVGELAAATGTKSSTLTSVLDRLERKGALERIADDADRRSVLIRLTPPGRRTATRVQRAVATLEHSALAGLSPGQLAGFFAVTRALTAATQ